jgi:hypothetical protein
MNEGAAMTGVGTHSLSLDYEATYGRLLVELGTATRVEPPELTAFWPMVGHKYTGNLMVVGRAVNGWIDHITVDKLGDPAARGALLKAARRTAEGSGACPMGWVTPSTGA